MAVTNRLIGSIALTLTLLTPAAAQAVPDLSGTWVMVPDRSNFGPIPGPQSRTDVIVHREPSLTIKRTVMAPNGVTEGTLVYAVDGKSYHNKIGETEVTSILKWDGEVLVVESTITTGNGDLAALDRFTLSADKKTLTQARTLSLSGQEANQTIVFAKQ